MKAAYHQALAIFHFELGHAAMERGEDYMPFVHDSNAEQKRAERLRAKELARLDRLAHLWDNHEETEAAEQRQHEADVADYLRELRGSHARTDVDAGSGAH